MYEELNNAFPNQFWFYSVEGLNLTDAMERCVRLTGDASHITTYQGRVIFASTHEIGNDIPWLSLIGGPPVVTPEEE